jgi:hypothetical protein
MVVFYGFPVLSHLRQRDKTIKKRDKNATANGVLCAINLAKTCIPTGYF